MQRFRWPPAAALGALAMILLPSVAARAQPATPAAVTTASVQGLSNGLLGHPAIDMQGRDAGTVVDILLDPQTSQPTHLIVKLIGMDKNVALTMEEIRLDHGGTQIRIWRFTSSDLNGLPPYQGGAPSSLAGNASTGPALAAWFQEQAERHA